MSDSKIEVKVGIVEFSGEGNQDWLAKQLDKILEKIPELLKIEVGNTISPSNATDTKLPNNEKVVKSKLELSVLNIAGKLNAKSASELLVAAAGYLHFVEGKERFTREDLSATMKKANGIYKDNMMGNLSKTLTQLEKNGTFLKSSSLYSLNVDKVNELNAKLS